MDSICAKCNNKLPKKDNTTVQEVKAIAKKSGIDQTKVGLYFNGQALQDKQKIKHSGIGKESTIMMTHKAK